MGTFYRFGVSFYYFFLAFIQKNWFTGVGCPSAAAKVHLLTMSALCCILFNYYVGDLTATMTVGTSVERLASFQDVVDKARRKSQKHDSIQFFKRKGIISQSATPLETVCSFF